MTVRYMVLDGATRSYSVHGVTGCYTVLHGVTLGYKMLRSGT